MTVRLATVLTMGAATMAVAAGLAWSGEAPTGPLDLIASAHAIIGRPLTPMSYAGVARRTTYRAAVAAPVYGAPVYGAPVYVAPPPAYYPPECVRVVDPATGAVVYHCP